MDFETEKTYRLESIYIGFEGNSERMVNGQPEFDAVYTALIDYEENGEMFFVKGIQGMYYDTEEKIWNDIGEEDQENLKQMMTAAIISGEAEEVVNEKNEIKN